MKSTLPDNYRPSVKDAEWFLNYWKQQPNYADQEKALDKLFIELCPKNDCLEDVLIKCSALNDFYSTNIFNVHSLSEHILSLNIDDRLEHADLSLVKDIANVEINWETHNFYSFATKYCSHHKPHEYAIYDNYVEKVLIAINKIEPFGIFKKKELKDYDTYMYVIQAFRQHFGLEHFSIKQLDQYLWQLGKWYFNSYGPRYKYYNREDKSPYSIDDVRSKFWHGEKMFVKGNLSVGYWKASGKKFLQNANDRFKQFAEKYSPEQFGVIYYIVELYAKWCPYDSLEWIYEY